MDGAIVQTCWQGGLSAFAEPVNGGPRATRTRDNSGADELRTWQISWQCAPKPVLVDRHSNESPAQKMIDRHAARAAGFDAHCAKPVTTMALVELIDGLRNTDAA
jgi:hypothetical protein